MIMIIIITLFQEENIFGTDASPTYGPRLTNVECYKELNRHTIIYIMYRVDALRTPS